MFRIHSTILFEKYWGIWKYIMLAGVGQLGSSHYVTVVFYSLDIDNFQC